ncbi:MAG: acetyl-coenzyme A synthetase N-terminal domain-containing protein [Nitrososphaerota archaeon]
MEAKPRYYGQKFAEYWRKSLEDPESFWSEIAENPSWFWRWDKLLEWDPPFARWFVGGIINSSYNALAVNLKKGVKNKVAIFWKEKKEQPARLHTTSYGKG